MRRNASERLLRVPVRYVDGHWECAYGGIVPVEPDTEGELVLNDKSITDASFLNRMRAKSRIKVLEQGEILRAYLATKDQATLTDAHKSILIPWRANLHEIATEYIDNWNSGDLSLVEVSIGKPTDQQKKKFDTEIGGLWLLTSGPDAVGLETTTICLPGAVSKEPVISLNHAFTKLSEVLEPWRISHTGNVYKRFLYKEANGKWYPLELLRNAILAKQEEEIAHRLYKDFIKRMSPNAKSE